jgi:hypothetical protein
MLLVDLPDDEGARAACLQELLIAHATGGPANNGDYVELRRGFLEDAGAGRFLPQFVRSCPDLASFWGWIKVAEPTYAARRELIWRAFVPLLDHLESADRPPSPEPSPLAGPISLETAAVRAAWERALARSQSDPEGAILAAHTLIEGMCRRVLYDAGASYGRKDELPKLYGRAAKALKIGPSHRARKAMRPVFEGCTDVVLGLLTLPAGDRDSPRRGGKKPIRAAPRHAQLAVNLAGALALFLAETWEARRRG